MIAFSKKGSLLMNLSINESFLKETFKGNESTDFVVQIRQ